MSDYALACPSADPHRLVEDNLPLAYAVATTFFRGARAAGLEEDDVRQEAAIGLMRAAEAFDAGRGCGFASFAWRAVRHHLIKVLRTRRSRALQQLPLGADAVELDPPDHRHQAEPGAGPDVEHLLSRLPQRWRQVLEMRFREGLRLHEIAERAGMSKERCRQLILAALRRLRQHAGQDEVGATGA
jgi:RNA polymerase sigma factor (sigma-70 family)